jgi:hypothetical protein
MERSLRWAIRVHPRSWRDRYGQEVLELSEELLGTGESTVPRLFLGLLASCIVERGRSLLRMNRLALAISFTAILVVVAVTTLVTSLVSSGGAAHMKSTLTYGQMPTPARGGQLDLRKVPDFVAVGSGGKIDGYEPRAYLFSTAGKPVSPMVGAVGPVYARDLKTLVGHMVPGVGFVPLGRSPDSEPCTDERTISSNDGTTTTSIVACPSTIEVVPNVVGMYTPTAMGELSGLSLSDSITYVHSASVPAGHIVSVTPPPGASVHARSQVDVVSAVSPGAPIPGG